MGHVTSRGIGADGASTARRRHRLRPAESHRAAGSSFFERMALAAIGLSIAVLGIDSAIEANDGLELIWLSVGTAGLALGLVALRGRCQPFTRLARLLRLPPIS